MPPRVALVHDWLTGMRGGEKALEVLCERFPTAELFTLVYVPGSVSPAIERLRPHTSFVQRLPFVARWYRQYLPLFPAAIAAGLAAPLAGVAPLPAVTATIVVVRPRR